MKSTLKTLLPTTLPMARSTWPDRADCTDTAISGELVPKATTVSPTTRGEMPADSANRDAPRTSASAPTTAGDPHRALHRWTRRPVPGRPGAGSTTGGRHGPAVPPGSRCRCAAKPSYAASRRPRPAAEHLGNAPSLPEGGRRPRGLTFMVAETGGHQGDRRRDSGRSSPSLAPRRAGVRSKAQLDAPQHGAAVEAPGEVLDFEHGVRGVGLPSVPARAQDRLPSPAAGWRNTMGTGWAMAEAGIPGRPIPLIALAFRVGKPPLGRAGTKERGVT